MYPASSITDAQWSVLEPLLPAPGNTRGRGGRPEAHPRRLVLDAIFYLVRGGIAWAALPHDFPPHQTVYGLFTRWARQGAWQQIHDALRDLVRVHEGRDPLPTAAIIDSQSVRGADTVPGRSRGYDAGKKINGRKRHIAVATGGLLLAVVVTIAGVQDRDAGHRLLTALASRFSRISLVWADGGSAGRLVVWAKKVLSLTVEVVKRTDDVKGFKWL
ncbi:IS5 family transposase [Pseudonocardia asaccharolytica]|uniref:IS5 family transposase n=2 Tax=Pseudonocardia asaccharolytica TaxID=54010 RepID=UPI001B7F819E|nr:IS5 family transposase [Pseudonocardia asaccharolytica]